MRIGREAQLKLEHFLLESVDMVLNNGEAGPIERQYFLSNFSVHYGRFPAQQSLTNLANALLTLSFKGEVSGNMEVVIKNAPKQLASLKDYTEQVVNGKQRTSVLSMIGDFEHCIAGLGKAEEVHARR